MIATNKMTDVQQVLAAVTVAIICKRRKKKRMVKEVWERELLTWRRTDRGVYRQLLEELTLENEFYCIIFEIVLVRAIKSTSS